MTVGELAGEWLRAEPARFWPAPAQTPYGGKAILAVLLQHAVKVGQAVVVPGERPTVVGFVPPGRDEEFVEFVLVPAKTEFDDPRPRWPEAERAADAWKKEHPPGTRMMWNDTNVCVEDAQRSPAGESDRGCGIWVLVSYYDPEREQRTSELVSLTELREVDQTKVKP